MRACALIPERGRSRSVAGDAEWGRYCCAGRAVQAIPDAGRRTEYGDVGPAVAVVIAGHGLVLTDAELRGCERTVRAIEAIPDACRRSEHGDVGLSVAVKIGGRGQVFADAEL